MDEISYGATISNNTIIRNGLLVGGGWIAGDGVFISTASNVEAFNNVISGNADGIVIYEDPTRGSGSEGTYSATNENIHDNYITIGAGTTDAASGLTGFMSIAGGAEQYPTNSFANDHYCLSAGDVFQVGSDNTNQSGWQAAGYDTTGTFNCSPVP